VTDLNDKHILVTGIQRSGTTFTSKILSQSPELIYLPEPFNPQYGLEGVEDHFTYFESRNEDDKTVLLLNDLFSREAKYKKNYSKDGFIKRTGKFIFGSRAQIRYKISGIQNKRLLIKDPDAAFLSEKMHLEHNCQIMVCVRHPCAVLASYKRLGWQFDFETLLRKEYLMENHLSEFEAFYKKENKTLAEQVGMLWVSVYNVLRIYSEQHENWLTILHEDLCNEPEETFKDIFKWAGISITDSIKQMIVRKTSSGNPVTARGNILHDFSRDSANLATYWKEVISTKERKVVKQITDPISSLFYDEESWN
jgi:hypothetical protein|tara:strand:- start:1461 stop:2387 length:927 start_codon:yes stop_codon:yes gene_type:complete